MNKKSKQIVPLCFLIAIIIFIAIVYTMISSSFEEYQSAVESNTIIQTDYENSQNQYNKVQEQKQKDELQLQSIKPVYETTEGIIDDNLSVFGTMFEDIIRRAQNNGLLIRSIEYEMFPAEDSVYSQFADSYNVCELKFFFVGSYTQLKTFLTELVNNFQYLISISRLNVTAFESNSDYLLINMSVTLYAKKAKAPKGVKSR